MPTPTKRMKFHAPNAIWYNSKYHASPSLLKTCSSRVIDMTDPHVTQGTLDPHTSREYKSTRGLLLALSPRDFFIFSVSCWAGCQLQRRPYMASMPGVVTLWAGFISSAKLETWNQKWCVTSLTLTHLIISYSNDLRSMPTGFCLSYSINAFNMWMVR